MFLLQLHLEIEFQFAIALNAIKRYLRQAYEFAKGVLS